MLYSFWFNLTKNIIYFIRLNNNQFFVKYFYI
ncbi:Hypothetical protein FNO222_1632 [Francisella orientalis]|uniref:Uncharacterized protein n=1 Tax=Francisella orientalis TaxID=299583 RepID=A0ABM5U7K6_9GAMM|nr:hypothetical protein FNO12_1617 [Francisella orientalis FNO12]AKN87684.1 Hypothetical protein FNO24_1619 [Francisella orientalis FNO24]AKN89222.1 Hypothetical protein FNO190_1617 [Francisella orientalis]AKU05981.1 Hypothetical protein FNO01_1617 [Francisella orientalis]QEN20899.1 Hypothetical protein FNO39_1632 [Francisella orientalis]